MADRGHELTDEILRSLQDRIAEEYADALRAAEKKLKDYLDAFNAEDEIQKQRLADGEITKEQYNAWAIRRKMNGKHWEEMRDALASDFHHATEMALDIAEGRMPDVYALNHNFGVYEIESGGGIYTGMTLYNHDTAKYLLSQQRQLMPGPSTAKQKLIAAHKDMQWNQHKIQSAVLQGVLLGDGPEATARRLMGVARMDYNAAVRYARTMTTSAQNAGRYESYRRASELGVKLTIEWQATLDAHTRHDHRLMHGRRTEVDEPFKTPDGFTILYPADCSGVSTAPQGQIWNCRCTLRPWVKGHEGKTVTESPGMEGMSFEEWQGYKEMSAPGDSFTMNPSPGETINAEDLQKFADEVSARGYRFAPSVTGINRPAYGGFETYCGEIKELYSILDELDASKTIWTERLKRKGVLIGYEAFGTEHDFARSAGRTIFFNKKVYDDSEYLRKSYADAVAKGVFVEGTTEKSIPWHELGHILQNLDLKLYGRAIRAIEKKGDIRTIGLQLTSGYGISEVRDNLGFFGELVSELLSASRSSVKEKRENALEILKEVLS